MDEVTSDLAFVARGATLADLFRTAAEALLAATLEDPAQVSQRVRRSVHLEEPDLELLLLRFLNELVYLRDAEHLLLRAQRVRVAAGDAARLEAELVGEAIDLDRHQLATEVKAVTAHGLRVAQEAGDGGGSWEASVTLDV